LDGFWNWLWPAFLGVAVTMPNGPPEVSLGVIPGLWRNPALPTIYRQGKAMEMIPYR